MEIERQKEEVAILVEIFEESYRLLDAVTSLSSTIWATHDALTRRMLDAKSELDRLNEEGRNEHRTTGK